MTFYFLEGAQCCQRSKNRRLKLNPKKRKIRKETNPRKQQIDKGRETKKVNYYIPHSRFRQNEWINKYVIKRWDLSSSKEDNHSKIKNNRLKIIRTPPKKIQKKKIKKKTKPRKATDQEKYIYKKNTLFPTGNRRAL